MYVRFFLNFIQRRLTGCVVRKKRNKIHKLNFLFLMLSGTHVLGRLFSFSITKLFRASTVCRELAPEHQLEFKPIIFVKTILGPDGGFAGEERLVKREVAMSHLECETAVEPCEETLAGVWCYNPETEQNDKYVARTAEFLALAARKRQWLDLYWRVNTGYLLFSRRSFGGGWRINCPLRKKDVVQKLWQQYRVRVDPSLIEFREKDKLTGIDVLGHNWCWLYMPGAEELGIEREVYDNKRVKVRVHLRKPADGRALY